MLAFTDGKTIKPMVSAQDHKRIFDGDQGLNTGGMGAYSPAPIYTAQMHEYVVQNILQPTIEAMAAEGRPFSGVLYAGLMLTADGPKVLEYNARFGDPETQAILPRLQTDLADIMLSVVEKRLDQQTVAWSNEACVCVVLASGGYPESSEKGVPINGLDKAAQKALVFHAGTAQKEQSIVTNGGRVLGVSALGTDIASAIEHAYQAVADIQFMHMQYRTDIGQKALQQQ